MSGNSFGRVNSTMPRSWRAASKTSSGSSSEVMMKSCLMRERMPAKCNNPSTTLDYAAHISRLAMTARRDAAINHAPVPLRSYANPLVPPALHDIKIWEAARATSAAPTFFGPITVGGFELIDGGMGANNPSGWRADVPLRQELNNADALQALDRMSERLRAAPNDQLLLEHRHGNSRKQHSSQARSDSELRRRGPFRRRRDKHRDHEHPVSRTDRLVRAAGHDAEILPPESRREGSQEPGQLRRCPGARRYQPTPPL